MAGFNRFGGGGLGSLYAGINSLQQPSGVNRREDRFDDRRNARNNGGAMGGFDRRGDRDFGRLNRETSPRRRRYSPDPPYSGIRGNRRDNQGELGSYSMDQLGRDNLNRNRGQSTNDRDHIRDGHNMGPPNRGDGILGAKPGDMPRDLTSNTSSGFTSQLAQQQQLMAMVQTQSLLAAIQAQASAVAKRGGVGGPGLHPPSLLQGLRMQDNRGHMDNRQNRKRRMSPNRGGQQRNRNQINHRQQRTMTFQQQRNWQGNRSNYQQRRDVRRDRNRSSESRRKSEDNEPIEEPYVEENLDDEDEKEVEATKNTQVSKGTTTKKTEDSSSEQPSQSEDSEPLDNLSDDQQFKSEFNLAGQNVNILVKSLFDTFRGKYVCKVCKIMCTREMCFKQHLHGRRHVKTWLESRGHNFEAEMFKKASEEAAKSVTPKEQDKTSKETNEEEASEEPQEAVDKEPEESVEIKTGEEPSVPTESPDETPSVEVKEDEAETKISSPPPETKTPPVVAKEEKKAPVKAKEEKKIPVKEEKLEAKYSCDTRKMAIKDEEYITISSITEARVRLRGFDKGVNTLGCEFVKAVSGFNCRLCKSFILSGGDVMKHVEGRKHQAKYRQYIREHPKYESNQALRNKELSDMLSEREGEEVLLYEVIETEEEKRLHRYGSLESTLDVQVTKYVAAEDEADDSLFEDHDESKDDTHGQDVDVSDSGHKKEDLEDELLDSIDGEDKDLESLGMDENLLLETHENPEEENLEEAVKEPKEDDKNDNKDIRENKEDPNTTGESLNESQKEDEEPVEKKAKLITPIGRRGRKGTRGGTQGRGRGRGRGGKRTTRQSPRVAPQLVSPSDERLPEQNNDDVNFMDGYEVIDEVEDDE